MPTPPAAPTRPARHLWLLALVCLAAFWLRSTGLHWPRLHPDEPVIASWLQQVAAHGDISGKLYACGFFKLARPIQGLTQTVFNLGHAWAWHLGAAARPEADPLDSLMFIRWLNVCLGTLTVLLVFGLARRVTGSGAAGLLAAALVAGAQYPVEHCHYAETDIAMVLLLAAAAWLWIAALAGRRPLVFAAAALVAGFAAGTKFPLLFLMPLIPATAPLVAGGPSKRAWHMLALAGGGLALFALGFVLANPLALANWEAFRDGLAWERRRLAGETALNLGLLRNDPAARYLLHLRHLVCWSLSLGWGWLTLALVGIPCALRREYRRFWPVLLLFPALFAGYWIFFAPWVRTQEFMVFLPGLAVLAALPLVILWRGGRRLPRAAAALAAALALTLNAVQGWRTAALFGWTDIRLLARPWLEQRLPDQLRIALESYTAAACPRSCDAPVPLTKIEARGLPYLRAQQADLALRAPGITGRGLFDSAGQRFPEPQRRFDEFLAGSELLAAWSPLATRQLATFVSPSLELWGLHTATPRHRLNLELPQPLLVTDIYTTQAPRPTWFPANRRLGAGDAWLIDRRRNVVAIGGPPITAAAGGPFLVLNTGERGAVVRVQGAARRRNVQLAPQAAAVLPLERFLAPDGGRPFKLVGLRADTPADIIYLPCHARLAATPSEAARICADLDCPEDFWKAFAPADLESGADPIQRYRLAVAAGRWELADRWESAAALAGEGLAKILRAAPETIRINGQGGQYYDLLARIRLPGQSATGSENLFNLPLRAARGQAELRGEICLSAAGAAPASLTLNTGASLEMPANDAWQPFILPVAARRETPLALTVRTRTSAHVILRNLELRWTLRAALETTARSLAIARATHARQRGRPGPEVLGLLPHEPHTPFDLEVLQLEFAVLSAAAASEPRLASGVARQLLELAPRHYRGLLAAEEPACRTAAARLAGNLPQPVPCGPFLAIAGLQIDAGRRELSGVLEALRNDTPPLAITLHGRRRGSWRHYQTIPLGGPLHRGERVAGRVVLDAKFGPRPDPRQIALGVASDVQWHASRLPIAGRRDDLIPLVDLLPAGEVNP